MYMYIHLLNFTNTEFALSQNKSGVNNPKIIFWIWDVIGD